MSKSRQPPTQDGSPWPWESARHSQLPALPPHRHIPALDCGPSPPSSGSQHFATRAPFPLESHPHLSFPSVLSAPTVLSN